jgi:hypothetical protein
MPRPATWRGRPGSAVIPDGWSAHHRPIPEGASTGRCRVVRTGGDSTYDRATNTATTATATVVYPLGACRIQRKITQSGERTTADALRAQTSYEVTLDHPATGVQVGDRVDSITAGEDPDLTGRTLTVREVTRGTLAWSRILTCTLDEPGDQPWTTEPTSGS